MEAELEMIRSLTEPINELRAIRLSRKGAKAAQAGDIEACEKLYRRGLAIMDRTFGNVEATAAYTITLGVAVIANPRMGTPRDTLRFFINPAGTWRAGPAHTPGTA